MNSITINNLVKNYEKFKLDNVSFNVNKGYITGFIGPNGAGKTTVLKSILNLIKKDSGDIKLFDKDLETNTHLLNDVGVVLEYQYFSNDWTPIDVEKAISNYYENWDSNTYINYLNKFNLDKDKIIKDFSKGMKVKLKIACALSHNAKLLILDEPTSGLDPVARDELMEILQEYISDENNSVLFSTHITSDLEKIADYIVFIKNGKIIFDGEKDDLIEKYLLIKGGLNSITSTEKKKIIGYREYNTGFEGLIKSEDKINFNEKLIFEKVNLDEIIVFLNKEVHYEQR